MESAQCPVCNNFFEITQLPAHVDACLSGGGGGAPASPFAPPTPPAAPASSLINPAAFGSGPWICRCCTLQNEPEHVQCAACTADRYGPGEAPSPMEVSSSSSSSSSSSARALSADEELARKLAEEERAAAEVNTVNCGLCSKPCGLAKLFILDECSHKFCRVCITDYVGKRITKDVTIVCPIESCGKELSVRDTKDLLPKSSDGKSVLAPSGHGSKQATERIFAELKHINKSDSKKHGYSCQPLKDNLYHWEVRFFDFDKSEDLGKDLAKCKPAEILLHCVFPKDYPFSPPFIRIIKPRFQFRTGHVTVGGSICTEMLTKSGWTPTQSIEATLISIRTNLVVGGARIDTSNKHDYSESEAREAFERMRATHGW